MKDSQKKYQIWLELDEYDIESDKYSHEEYCNAIITFSDGSKMGLNIWNEKYFNNNCNNLDWIDEEFAILPDIIVKIYQSSSIRKAIINLIDKQNYLEGRGFLDNE